MIVSRDAAGARGAAALPAAAPRARLGPGESGSAGDRAMSTHVAPHQGVAGGAGRGSAGPRTAWLTGGQVALRAVQLGLLGAILLGSSDAARLLFRDPRGQKLLFGALVLTAGVLGA